MSQAIIDPTALDEATRAALTRHILTLADSKRLLGIRYSDWLLGAPSIESGIAASSMCQDEWGHARLLYAMLKELGMDPQETEQSRTAEQYCNADGLDAEFPDWAWVVAATVLLDGAVSAALESFAEGGFEVAQTRVPKMLAEEAFHQDFGAAWFRRIAQGGTDEARQVLSTAVTALLPRTLGWLDPDDSDQTALASAGLIGSGRSARTRFEARVRDLLGLIGIDVSQLGADRSNFDTVRRRGPGHPDSEAIERARGDRNRALFVE